ncbi:MAG TPA: hypothetical protein VGH76_01690 [Actinomycetospora sp.]|jgi:hypothetical protein|uniref:hypothetical protein n=1 Tax=Actinomycetospora sp. TaxID=1872135 RepID=UPI002F400AC3
MVLVARLVTTAAAAGGLLLGSVALGGGIASAAPAPTALVPASCGQTVSAMPGDTVRVTPRVGVPQDYTVGGAPGTTAHIPSSMARPGCDVNVQMLAPPVYYAPAPAPVAAAPMAAAPAAAPGAVAPAAVGPCAAPAAPPLAAAGPAAAPAAPAPRAAAAAPAPKASTAHSSRTAASSDAGALGAAAPFSPSQLLAPPPAAPAPAAPSAPADPAANVVSASNNSALPPADSSGGMGVPVLIALIAGTGVAAMGVRMFLMRRGNGSTPAHAAGAEIDPSAEPVTAYVGC